MTLRTTLAIAGLLLVPSAATGQFAYVANDVSHNVSVVDTRTNSVVATIALPGSNPASTAVTPDGKFVYVANNPVVSNQGTVSVIDTATNLVSATIVTGGGPYGIAMAPDGTRVYVTNFYASGANQVWVIDTATNTLAATIPVGSYPHGIAVAPAGDFVYVANTFSQSVSVIATSTLTVTQTITLSTGDSPHGVAVSPDGSLVYVSNYGNGTVSVISTSPTPSEVSVIPLATAFIEGIVFSRNGSLAYVAHQHDDFVSVIDTATNTVVRTVQVGTNPFGLAMTPDGGRVYVANQGSANVSVIDTATDSVVATIASAPGSFPANLAIGPAIAPNVCALYDETKVVKSGATIPIKLQLCNDDGENLSSPDKVLHAFAIVHLSTSVSGEPEDAGHANPDNNFRYSAELGGTGGYIFNLKTTGLAPGTYELRFTVGTDPAVLAARFQIR